MKKGEEQKVCSLVEKVFNEFVAPDYGREGIEEFFKFANPVALAGREGSGQVVLVAEQGTEIAGVIEMRELEHIAILFVTSRGQGIAKELIIRALAECSKNKPGLKRITVNSSRFAETFYAKMGFKTTGPFQEKNGIKFVPMVFDIE